MTPDEYLKAVLTTESCDWPAIITRVSDPHVLRLLHAFIGKVTEAAELMDQLKKHLYYGKPLDRVHMIEELGDSYWYDGIALDELRLSGMTAAETLMSEVWPKNIAKLEARYKGKFTETRAENRDLEAERRILEGSDPRCTCGSTHGDSHDPHCGVFTK